MLELMGYTSILYNWKEYIFHRGCSWRVQCILGSDSFRVEKKALSHGKQSSLHLPDEELHDDYAVRQKVHYHSHWKRNQDAVYWKNCPKHKIKDCNSGKQSYFRSSPTILREETASSEQLPRGDQVLFERLPTPRPAPKVTLNSNWLVQQQQPICNEDVTGTSKVVAEWEGQFGTRDGTRDVRG